MCIGILYCKKLLFVTLCLVSDTEIIGPVLNVTKGGADAIIDFVGLGSAANRLVNCLSRVCVCCLTATALMLLST